MAKPDSALLDHARYPFLCTVATRFADLDPNRHLNNVALVEMMEDARVRFYHASGFYRVLGGSSAMVVSFAAEYLGQAYYPQPLDVHIAVVHIGRTSYVMQQLSRQGDRVVACSRSVLVCVADNQPVPFPAGFSEDMAGWMLRP